MYILRVKTW